MREARYTTPGGPVEIEMDGTTLNIQKTHKKHGKSHGKSTMFHG
jgi:hypothetical protein